MAETEEMRPDEDTADTDMAWDRYLEHLQREQERVLTMREQGQATTLAAARTAGKKTCVSVGSLTYPPASTQSSQLPWHHLRRHMPGFDAAEGRVGAG